MIAPYRPDGLRSLSPATVSSREFPHSWVVEIVVPEGFPEFTSIVEMTQAAIQFIVDLVDVGYRGGEFPEIAKHLDKLGITGRPNTPEGAGEAWDSYIQYRGEIDNWRDRLEYRDEDLRGLLVQVNLSGRNSTLLEFIKNSVTDLNSYLTSIGLSALPKSGITAFSWTDVLNRIIAALTQIEDAATAAYRDYESSVEGWEDTHPGQIRPDPGIAARTPPSKDPDIVISRGRTNKPIPA
ncbi:hypothetical protein ACW9HC_32305 [Nocardia gipuzkoensis]